METPKNTVFTEIEINATPEEVWNVLTDWKKLNEWSSSFVGISVDRLVKGESFKVYFKNPLNGEVLELGAVALCPSQRFHPDKFFITVLHRFDRSAALRKYNFSTLSFSQNVEAFLNRKLMIRRIADSIIPLPHISLLSS